MMKILTILGIVFGAFLGIVFFGLVILGTHVPETSVYPGQQVPKKYLAEIKSLGLLEEGERVKYFYTDAMFDIKEGMYIVTDKHLILYSNTWGDPKTIIDYNEIAHLEVEYDDSFFVDSFVTVETQEGLEVVFPVSSEYGRDKKFVEHIRAHMPTELGEDDDLDLTAMVPDLVPSE